MLTHLVELYAEALNIGVTIDTTEPDQLTLDFWSQKSGNGKYRHVLEITKEVFNDEIAKPFSEACAKSFTENTHQEFSDILHRITGKKTKLSDTDIEEFRDFMDAIAVIGKAHEQNSLPWQ